MPTGEIEVSAESMEVLNTCRTLPFEMKDFVKVRSVSLNNTIEACFVYCSESPSVHFFYVCRELAFTMFSLICGLYFTAQRSDCAVLSQSKNVLVVCGTLVLIWILREMCLYDLTHSWCFYSCLCFLTAEIRGSPDAVQVSRPSLTSNAIQSETALTAGDENERVPLQFAW